MIKLIIYGLIAAAVMGAIYGAWRAVDHWCNAACVEQTERADVAEKGRVTAQAQRDAHKSNLDEAVRVNTDLIAANKQVVALYKEQETACVAASDATIKAQEETRRLRAASAELTKGYTAQIVQLVKRVNTPTVAGENVCAEATIIGRTVMRDRQRLRDGK